MDSAAAARMKGSSSPEASSSSPGKASMDFVVQVQPHTHIVNNIAPATSWLIQGKSIKVGAQDDLHVVEDEDEHAKTNELKRFKSCAVHVVQSHSGEVHSVLLQKSHMQSSLKAPSSENADSCEPWMQKLLLGAAITLTPVMQAGRVHTDTPWGHKQITRYVRHANADGHALHSEGTHPFEVDPPGHVLQRHGHLS